MDLGTIDEDAFVKLLDEVLRDATEDNSHRSNNEEAGDYLILTLPTGIHIKVPVIGSLNGEKVYQCPPELEALLDLQNQRRRKKKRQVGREEKPYIKKPPNAFMLFMKEMRPTIAPKLWKQGSGAVNQILGKMWGSLSAQEKALYFEEAEKCKKVHQLENPGWTTKDNYGKKRRRERERALGKTEGCTPQLNEGYAKTEDGAQPRVMPGNYLQTGIIPPFYPQPSYMPNYQSQHRYMQCPQRGGYMQFLQHRYIQDPQGQFPHEGSAHYLQQGGYVENPQQTADMQSVQQPTCTKAVQTEVVGGADHTDQTRCQCCVSRPVTGENKN